MHLPVESAMPDRSIVGALVLVLAGGAVLALAQNRGLGAPPPDPAGVRLTGGRFRPLAYEEMTPEQKTMFHHVVSGERRGAGGPFNVLLRSPEMGDLAQQFGASMRFHSSLPPKLNELAIIITARHWTSQYEWYVHRRAAQQAGLSEAIIQALVAGRRPTGLAPDEKAVYDFCTELLTMHQVSDATFNTAKARFGERGVVDLIGVSGYYGLVSMLLNVDQYPLPAGANPELKPLR
jgi:4-carboxymuconolactone decarboxylase